MDYIKLAVVITSLIILAPLFERGLAKLYKSWKQAQERRDVDHVKLYQPTVKEL